MQFEYRSDYRDGSNKYLAGFIADKEVGYLRNTYNQYQVYGIDLNWSNHSNVAYKMIKSDASNIQAGKKFLEQWYEENKQSVDNFMFRNNVDYNVSYLTAGNNNDFYPTPPSLAGKMMARVNWNKVETILEPSAGKGDIVDSIVSYMVRGAKIDGEYYRRRDKEKVIENIDVIELDENLQGILLNKGYHLVYDDFLSFHNYKHYDLIIMNPPFSDADKHLLKAISMQENGGQIICLLNAQTLKNPYTTTRRLLVDKLNQYGARIEYIKNAFKHSERMTDVEIAMVYVDIPEKELESTIWDSLKKAQKVYNYATDEKPNALMSANNINALIESYNMEARAGIEIIKEYFALSKYLNQNKSKYDTAPISLNIGRSNADSLNDSTNQYLHLCRLKYWKHLLESPELYAKMTSDMRRQYGERVNDLANYEFDDFNINRFIIEISLQLQDGIIDSIYKLFDKLTCEHAWYPECKKNIHYYNGWSTNKAWKIGKKVILPIDGYSAYLGKNELRDCRIADEMSDLQRAMSYLDCGQKESYVNIENAIRQANANGSNTITLTWFTATFYKKGTCHIKFNDAAQKIIDRLNIMVGRNKGWLPPCYGKVSYADMDDRSRVIVDEFQGEEEYNRVFANPSNYILESNNVGYAMLQATT